MRARGRKLLGVLLGALAAYLLALGGVGVASAGATVAIEGGPAARSNDTTPSFSGSTDDLIDPVSVQIYAGAAAEGTPVRTLTGGEPPLGGTWSLSVESPLADGTYTAVAEQHPELGEPVESPPVTFTIDTSSPTVTLAQPTSPSNDTTPAFTGFASDTTTVTVEIYAGASASGPLLASASAEGDGGEWASGPAAPPLESGQYTAVAVQESSLGNPVGKSNPVTFTIETGPPHVTLNQPTSPSNDTTPSFTGSASDTTPVAIDIYAGPSAEGPVVASAAATGTGGSFTSGAASPALPSGEYTAVAIQESSLLGNPAGVSQPVTFIVDTSSPTVTLSQPPSPSNDSTPTFSGTASDTTKVTVRIFDSGETEVAHATATPAGGSWSTSNESALPSGTYTAVASQESSLGNPPGESSPVSFTIDTEPPTVTLASPALRSNDTTPAFSGTASDTTPVQVLVYEGTRPEGTPVATGTAAVSGGRWESSAVTLAGGVHTYTAVATEESSLGNPTGRSNAVTFTVDTTSPTVTIDQPTTPSNDTTPSFSGIAGEDTRVTIRVYEGTSAKGEVRATATSVPSAGHWVSAGVSPALPDGTYTATATLESSLGNSPGTSEPVTFVVNTQSPAVTLNAVAKLSNNTTPSFSGTASDTTPVEVLVYEGTSAAGTPAATVTATPSSGNWSTATLAPALASGVHTYTAVATQESSLGNPAGKSNAVTFTVDTTSPTVTLGQPPSPSNNTSPHFSGTASATTTVTVRVYEGTDTSGHEVASASATPSGGTWKSGGLTSALSSGVHTYTAVASQESPLGNPAGSSAPVTFTVDTEPPTVTLVAPPTHSNDTAPTFSGTASDTTPVKVLIYEGVKAEGRKVAEADAPGTGGAWTSNAAKPALPTGKHTYTAIAVQSSSIGNAAGTSEPRTFIVDTAAPTVTMNAPPALTNDATPTFAGTASEYEPVTVSIHEGATASGPVVATATATGTGGHWSSAPASPALHEGQYTAVASQESKYGFHLGESASFTFTIDTTAPAVTLRTPANGSTTGSESQPVSGTAGTAEHDLPAVTVELFAGTTIEAGQAPAQSITVGASGGAWSAVFAGLQPGTYTVRAQQADQAGNVGLSAPSTFTVASPAHGVSAASASTAPGASFVWLPSHPHVGESVSLVSNSTDGSSPIVAFAWDTTGFGAFLAGGSSATTSFATAGTHLVHLRVTAANGLSSVASEGIPVEAPALPLLQPFPLVRITTTHARSGIRLRILGVLAPVGARITVQCHGPGCQVRTQSFTANARRGHPHVVELRRFELTLHTGAVLEIRVMKAGTLGKYTRLTVRRGGVLQRLDECLNGLTSKPVACPSS